ncbi:slit3 protein-like [Tropilaelaps mercedesae]|uniref:Slit3 protein-like n=1 Tax=Tropilaelaps mercedesae TaxID=418985 RepID=A0A1V9XDL7_9ACAR|nr:slit3 protein-like [Tropilaelaps mercedesae]
MHFRGAPRGLSHKRRNRSILGKIMPFYGTVLFVCLLLIGCVVVAMPQVSSSATNQGKAAFLAELPTQTSRLRKIPDICNVCTCRHQVATCSGKNNNDLTNVRVPENYNVLDLSNNALTVIQEETFVEGIDVTEVNLAYNQIKSIAPFAFRAFKNLSRLLLQHNHLSTLEDDSLAELPRLEKLDLSVNKFKRLNPEYLARLFNLKYLILDDNHLEGLHGSVFRNNTRLTHLYMNKLNVVDLDENLFQYTQNIRVLHLEDNFFEHVPHKALSKLPRLEVLALSGNPISILAPLSFPKLPSLQRLLLHNMYNLVKIEIYAFTDLPMLRDLKIQNCKNLLYIDPKAFVLGMRNSPIKYPSIKSLVIHDTSITTLSQDLLKWDGIDDLDLAKNLFHCNCNFSWVIDMVKKHEVNNDIRCHSPESLADHTIGRLQAKDLPCDDFDPLCHDPHLQEHRMAKTLIAKERGFSLLHLAVIVMFTVTIVLSILLVLSLKNQGFLYRKLGKPQPMTYAGGENVLYMRTTIDNY